MEASEDGNYYEGINMDSIYGGIEELLQYYEAPREVYGAAEAKYIDYADLLHKIGKLEDDDDDDETDRASSTDSNASRSSDEYNNVISEDEDGPDYFSLEEEVSGARERHDYIPIEAERVIGEMEMSENESININELTAEHEDESDVEKWGSGEQAKAHVTNPCDFQIIDLIGSEEIDPEDHHQPVDIDNQIKDKNDIQNIGVAIELEREAQAIYNI